jgi:hypothetical protein
MKSRTVKILLAVAILLLMIWIGSHLRFEETTIPLPLKGEAISNPFYAAIKLSEQLDADAAWERVFTVPATDSVILISNWNWDLSRTRRARLEKWVESGGRLVVDDSLIGGSDAFEKWSGISTLDQDEEPVLDESDPIESDSVDGDEPREVKKPVQRKKKKPERRRMSDRERALVQQFINDDCTQLTEDVTQRALQVCGLDSSRSLASARKITWALRDRKEIHAVRVAIGSGSVTMINASPFRYRTFLEGDHPALFVSATQLHHGDSLLFLTEEEHASLLTLVWRFGAPVVLLLAVLVTLSLWRSSARFGPLTAPPDKARRSLAEQIRGSGQFTLRFGGGRALHTALVRAVREAAIRRVTAYDQLSTEERVATLAKLTGQPESELGPALNYSGARSSNELRNVIAVLETARRSLMRKKHGN